MFCISYNMCNHKQSESTKLCTIIISAVLDVLQVLCAAQNWAGSSSTHVARQLKQLRIEALAIEA